MLFRSVENEALQALQLPPVETARGEVLCKHLRGLAQAESKAMAQILRGWLDEKGR